MDLNPQNALSFLRKKSGFDAKWSENPEGNPAYARAYDGWLMVLGRLREAFGQLEFFKMYLHAYEEILKLRKMCNVRVLRDMDSVYQAVQEVKRAQNIPESKKYRNMTKDMKSFSLVMRKIQGSHRCLILLLRVLFSETHKSLVKQKRLYSTVLNQNQTKMKEKHPQNKMV